MSDYGDPNDPLRRSTPNDARSYAGWGWLAAAVFVIIVLAIGFGMRNERTRTASNDVTQTTRMAPPATTNPGIASPATPAPLPAPGAAPAPGANPAPQGSQ